VKGKPGKPKTLDGWDHVTIIPENVSGLVPGIPLHQVFSAIKLVLETGLSQSVKLTKRVGLIAVSVLQAKYLLFGMVGAGGLAGCGEVETAGLCIASIWITFVVAPESGIGR